MCGMGGNGLRSARHVTGNTTYDWTKRRTDMTDQQRQRLYAPSLMTEGAMDAFNEVNERRKKESSLGESPSSPLPVEFCLICGDSFDEEGMCQTCGIKP